MSSSSRISSQPFVPSPRWLSESPGQPPSSGTSNSPWRSQGSVPGRFDGLLSPIPPPPANLYPGTPDAFNVDPGVPFLATAGSSDIPDSEEGSEDESSSRRKFVGGFVSGIRNSVRRSLRRRRRDSFTEFPFPEEQQEIQDSGYGSSSVTAPIPGSTEAQTSHEQGLRQSLPAQHYTTPYYTNFTPLYPKFNGYRNDIDAVSLFSGTVSAETASIQYGSDYRKMEAPLDTEDSLSAYIKRTKQFIHRISALPFTSKPRVTYDHFPERQLRDDPRRRSLVEWHRPGYGPTNYSPPDTSKPAVFPHEVPSRPNTALYTPHRVPAVELDLREEFNDAGPVPSLPTTNFAPPQSQPVQIVNGPPVTFQPIPTEQPQGRQTLSEGPLDHSWNAAINNARHSTRKRRMATPFHRAASIDAQTTLDGWQQYPHYRDGYVPPELAETHYGSRYGPGIHSARPGLGPFGSGPSSVDPRKGQKV